jgi:hypothetical protein
MFRFPLIAILTIVASYGAFGWLLAVNKAPNLIYWIASGSLMFAVNYFLALAWGVAAVIVVFVPKSDLIILSLGVTVVWATLLYIARIEMLGLINNRNIRFILMFFIVAIALGIGTLVDATFVNYKINYFWQKVQN